MYILRLWPDDFYNKDFFIKLVGLIKKNKGCCDEIWLCGPMGFPEINNIKDSILRIKTIMELFNANGIRTGIQFNSLGHSRLNPSEDNSAVESGILKDFMVDYNGKIIDGRFCWNGESTYKYFSEVITEYAQLKPFSIWIDDDLKTRAYGEPIRCFCDNCMRKFNNLHGMSYSRQELVKMINTDTLVRKQFIVFAEKGIGDLAFRLAKAVKNKDSSIHLGLQCGEYAGYGFLEAVKGMQRAIEDTVMVRTGAHEPEAYSDINPYELVNKAADLSWLKAALPDYCNKIYPEIETYPHSLYSKTADGISLETKLYFANGFKESSYAVFCSNNEPLEFIDSILNKLSFQRSYLEKISEINSKSSQYGLINFVPKDFWLSPFKEGDCDFDWMKVHPTTYGNEYLKLGFPITYSQNVNNGTYILHGKYAQCLSTEEIEFLLDKPVLTDGETLCILENRGYGSFFSARAEKINDGWGYVEKFATHPATEELPINKVLNALSFCEDYRIIDKTGETESLGFYYPQNSYREEINPIIADAVITTSKGARWIVQGFRMWDVLTSFSKKKMLSNALKYIGANCMDAELLSMHKCVIYCRKNRDNQLICINILNYSIAENRNVKISLKNCAGSDVYCIEESGSESPLNYEGKEGCRIVTVPYIGPWKIITLLFKN